MKKIDADLSASVFFVLVYAYYVVHLDASLIYQQQHPVFLFHWPFLKEFLQYPGGVLEWITLFFYQFFIWKWTGALILTLMVLGAFTLSYWLFKQRGRNGGAFLVAFIPAAFLLILTNRYDAPGVIAMRFLTASTLFALYSRFPKIKPLFVLLTWPMYLLLGGWVFLYYCLLVVIHEAAESRKNIRWIYAALHLAAAAALPWAAAQRFVITLREAYTYLYPIEFQLPPFRFRTDAAVIGLFASLPVLLILRRLFVRFAPGHTLRAVRSFAPVHSVRFQWICILAVSGGLLFLTHNRGSKTKIAIGRSADQGGWGEVIACSAELEQYDRTVNFQVNRARYFRSELLDAMFSYPQILGADGLFIHRLIASQVAVPASDLLYDLAHVNGAQAMAYEGQSKWRYHPRILQRLAMTHLINHQTVPALKFTALLKRSLVHRDWARRMEILIRNPGRAQADPEIRSKRALKPYHDFFLNRQHPNADLALMLEQRPENRMAFDYLIAYYLLDGRLMNVYVLLDRFPGYGYTKIPRHVQEAMLLLKTLAPAKVNLKQVSFDPQTLNRFKAFNMILARTMADPRKAKGALQKEFGDTYWFYARYLNPRKTRMNLTAKRIDDV